MDERKQTSRDSTSSDIHCIERRYDVTILLKIAVNTYTQSLRL